MAGSARVSVPLDAPQPTWDLLAGRLDELLRAWEASGAPPRLAALVREAEPALRRLVLSELVKADLDQRLRRGLPARLEDYLAEFPELAVGGVPCDLIYEEFQLRRRAGEEIGPDDCFRRFPDQAEALARLLRGTAPAQSTALFHARAVRQVEAGERLDDFDLLTLLGAGAFARVFLARQRSMQRLVALKVSADQGAEAQTLAQLDHPHIVRVHDVRVLPECGLRLLYMNYLSGGTLQNTLDAGRSVPVWGRSGQTFLAGVDAVLAARGESPPAESALRQQLRALSWPEVVCWLGARLARALDYAHRRGVLHRDVKPANVLLTAEGAPCLADFNVGCCSKLDGAGPAALFGGSLAYMSPEQLEAFDPGHPRDPADVDGRSDVYALGVTLWEMLTGERPFAREGLEADWGRTLAALAQRRRAGPSPEAYAELSFTRPAGLPEVLRTCLGGDPADRFATAGELACALELCQHPRLDPAPGGWRGWVRRHPLAALIPLGIVPNVLAALFNIDYNQKAIINGLSAQARAAFGPLMVVINGLFFPLCLALFVRHALPVARALRHPTLGGMSAAESRRRCLHLGAAVALICLGGWLAAGLLWPVSLDLAAGMRSPPDHLRRADYLHLLASLTLCGLIAAAYPFFLVTAVSVRVLYPALLRAGTPGAGDTAALARVERLLGPFLLLAVAVPLLAIALLALAPSPDRFALVVLSGAGLAGFGLAYLLERGIRADLAALARIVAPADGTNGVR